MIARARRPDRRIVVPGPRFIGEPRRPHHPADAQARQAVRLGQPVHDDHALVAAPQRRRRSPVPLRALVHLVRQQPGADLRRPCHDQPSHGVRQHVARRVVGVGDDNELSARRDRAAHFVSRGLPARLRLQRKASDAGAEVLGQTPRLQVVRQHDGDVVARLDQPPAHHEIRLRAAGRDEDLVRRHARVKRGDPASQQVGAVRLAVAKPDVEQRLPRRSREVEQLADRERMHTRLRQVVAHPVLPGALPAFQFKWDKAQGVDPSVGGRRVSM